MLVIVLPLPDYTPGTPRPGYEMVTRSISSRMPALLRRVWMPTLDFLREDFFYAVCAVERTGFVNTC